MKGAAFMLATETREDDPIFIPMLENAVTALGVDASSVQEVLAASEM